MGSMKRVPELPSQGEHCHSSDACGYRRSVRYWRKPPVSAVVQIPEGDCPICIGCWNKAWRTDLIAVQCLLYKMHQVTGF
jgi:hypothetical protein